jgi:uncharacterized surface protein with fasciclin (FAS1) repeats
MLKNRMFGLAAVLLAFGLVAAACGSDSTEEAPATTAAAIEEAPATPVLLDIVDTAVGAGNFTTLATALTEAGLIDTLKGEGPFTVFAPTDDAFAALPEGTVEGLLADIPALTDILTYHVVSGDVRAETVVGLESATTVQGADIAIEIIDGAVVLNGSSNVIATDIEASNGVIHVIDAVLLPPMADSAEAMGDMEEAMALDIVDTAVEAGSFTTLAAALGAADLVDTLKGEGPFTVFAPTDDAFAALPEGTVEGLLEDIPALTDILLYHVVAGEVPAETVLGLESAETVQGSDIAIEIVDGNVVLNGVTLVLSTDIVASNGIIHVIDSVLLP